MEQIRYTLGLDIGIGSVGWAVLQNDAHREPVKIVDLGVRVFEKAEHPKTGASLAAPRREARSARRRIRRRRHRKERIRYLIEQSGIMTRAEMETLFHNSGFEKSVYELRVWALEHLLTREELVRLLIHYAQRRGYKSNSTSEATKDAKENGKVKAALSANQERMTRGGYRTVGEMLWKDPEFRQGDVFKVRNTTDSYKLTQERSEVVREIRLVLETQIQLGSQYVTADFLEKYLAIFESQRNFDEGPGAGPDGKNPYGGNQIEKMLGKCRYEENELRAPKATYTFEYFRLLQELNHIRIMRCGFSPEPLTPAEREIVISAVMKSPNLTYGQLRKKLGMDEDCLFNCLYYGNKSIAEQEKKKLGQMQAYHKIRTALNRVQKNAIQTLGHEQLDAIGYILSIHKSDDARIHSLRQAQIPEEMIPALLELSFSKAGKLSLTAMKKLIPHLEQGITYDKALFEVYGQRAAPERKMHLSIMDAGEITNPVVRRAVSQSIKVINAIVRKYGPPEVIRVELARELKRTKAERDKAQSRQDKNRKYNEQIREQIKEYKTGEPTGLDIVKFKLFQEQDGVCLYSGKSLSLEHLFEPGYVDVDHIIPYSISFDDSYDNKVLVCSAENRMKGNQLPYEYMGQDLERWNRFEALVESKISNKKKRQNLLLQQLSEEQRNEWKKRNLVDTQTLSKVVYNLLSEHLIFAESAGKRPVEPVNGIITAQIRRRMGLDKYRGNGDKHHAQDAVVIACVSPGMTQKLTQYAHQQEMFYRDRHRYVDEKTGEIMTRQAFEEKYSPKFPEPWPQFRQELMARMGDNPREEITRLGLATYDSDEEIRPIFVSRMPNHKTSGSAHEDTIRREVPGGYIRRVPLTDLNLDKNGEIENYDEFAKERDPLLYQALLVQLNRYGGSGKKAFVEPFYKPKKDGTQGPVVKKVGLMKHASHPKDVRGGCADNHGHMLRIDVFYVEGEGYYAVPIYVSDTKGENLPKLAPVEGKPFEQWKEMQEKNFVFSLYSGDLVSIESERGVSLTAHKDSTLEEKVRRKKEFFYYGNFNTAKASISITTHDRSYESETLRVKSLLCMQKYQVDVLGNYAPVKIPEKRQGF